MTPLLSADAVTAYLTEAFPQATGDGAMTAEAIRPGEAVVRLDPGARHLRPGGTVSGPSLFALADYAAYVVILGHVGPVGLAVTTSAHIDFTVRPAPGRLICTAELVKLGSRLAVVDARVRDEGGTLVARSSLTYSLPPGWREAAAATDAGG